jgi:ubiquinone/menaquinone biosynthesis C-methylase UbiE
VALARARQRFPNLQFVLTGTELPFDDGSFDAIWLSEVLEHVQDGLGLLAEARRVARPNGRLLLTTPDHALPTRLRLALSARYFESTFNPRSDHVRFFTANSLRTTLTAAGASEVELTRRQGLLLASTTIG